MDPVITHGAALDVHQATVVATVRVPGPAGGRHVETRTFATMTADLLALRDWLQAVGVTHVAMESTGVYWRPIYFVLEDEFRLLLINMQHLKHVPGRKTDVKDSEWLAQLLEWGLLRSSLVPPPPIRELRDLTRYRKQQIAERTQEINRLHRMLQDAGVKLATVASDVMGVSGRAMLQALVAGTTDPDALAELARGRLRQKLPLLRRALHGRFRAHHALLVGHMLSKIEFLEEGIATLTTEIDAHLAPFEAMLARLDTIPGVDRRSATTILAETSGDMSHFPTAGHLCSWAAVCPGLNESGGKRRSGRTRKGNRYLRTALIEAALGATRAKGTALQARYFRVRRHRGHQKAVLAVAHQILEIAYFVMRDGVTYHELGADYFDRRDRERTKLRCLRQLQVLGYHVTLDDPSVAA
jgi:transposase